MNEQIPFIAEELLLARLAQSEQVREFFVQMWRESPQLAAKAGRRIQDLMSPLTAPPAIAGSPFRQRRLLSPSADLWERTTP
jgi:hypothetical protein